MSRDGAQLGPTLLKVVVPIIATGVVLVAARRRHLSWREDLGLARPAAGEALLWLALYLVLVLGSNHFMGWRGPWDFSIWARTPLPVAVLRILAVGILGPIAEELIFRGYLYARLIHTRLGAAGTIAVLAAGFAVLHTAYSGGVVALIFVAGLMLGVARYRSGTVVVPMLMHITWNLYAVW